MLLIKMINKSKIKIRLLSKLKIIIKNNSNFKLDLLFDIIYNNEESKKIYKKFILSLFVSFIKYNLDKHIEEILDEILFIAEFISLGLKNNEILKSILEQ